MPRLIHNTNRSAWIFLAAVVAIIGYQAFAFRPAQTLMIATFDLERTFNSLEEKTYADGELTKLAEGLNASTESKANSIKKMEADLDDLMAGTEKHRELLEKWSLASQEYQAEVEFYRAKLDYERARMLRKIYHNIRNAAKNYAQEVGYVVVFVDDSVAEIPAVGEQETSRQISARRIVYTSTEVDITDELIERMNKAFK